ncbi:MAG: hypothetical protein LH466_05375 [Sphingomonas bacterium]|nr:hypothetical protein [Sphingomonas bacterium]
MKLTLSILLAASVAGAAIAQSQPESILPPGFGDPPPPAPPPNTTPATPTPAPGAADAAPRRAPAPDLSRIEDIIASEGLDSASEIVAVAPPIEYRDDRRRNPALTGVIWPAAIGYSGAAWGSSSGKFLSVVLRRTDGPLASRWAHIGLRNMLLARTAAPGGVHPADWVAERAWLLLKLGEADAARLLVAGIDTDTFTPKMVQVAAQVALANGDPSGLCAIETELAKVEPKMAPLVTAMCASLAGESERAAADIEQARRRGRADPVDIALAAKVVGAGANTARATTIEWEPVTLLSSWRYGLSTATAMMPPERLITAAAPQVRGWLARAPMFSAPQKMAAARTAAAMGVMSSDAMVDLYSAAYDYADPDELGGTDPWRLRQAFVGKDRAARLSALRGLWGDAKDREKQMAGWVTTARAAVLVAPDAALADDASNLIAALFAGGYDRQAARWVPVVEDFDDAKGDAAWAMLALGLSAPAGLTIDQGRIEDFADRDTSPGKTRTGLLVAGLAGLGRIDAQVAGRLNAQYRLGLDRKTAWTGLIDGAAMRRQAGTAMLLAASAMQAPAIGELPALYMFHAVTALRRTGLEGLARMIAAEALARA